MSELQERNEGEPCLQQHDLLGAQSTVEIKKLRAFLNVLNCIIAGDMTAALQLTDIMAAKKNKDIVREHELEIKEWLRRKALQHKRPIDYTIGHEELMMIANRIYDGLQEWLEKYDWVLAGARKGGHLAYLPYMPDPKGDQADR